MLQALLTAGEGAQFGVRQCFGRRGGDRLGGTRLVHHDDGGAEIIGAVGDFGVLGRAEQQHRSSVVDDGAQPLDR